MTRWRSISARVGRAEAAGGAVAAPVPCVVTVGSHDTPRGALAAFAAAHPDRPRRHALMVVPAKASTPADRERFAERFRVNQARLVAEARSERLIVIEAAKPAAPSDEAGRLKRAKEAVASASVPVAKPTFSAANRLSPALLARLRGHPLVTF